MHSVIQQSIDEKTRIENAARSEQSRATILEPEDFLSHFDISLVNVVMILVKLIYIRHKPRGIYGGIKAK